MSVKYTIGLALAMMLGGVPFIVGGEVGCIVYGVSQPVHMGIMALAVPGSLCAALLFRRLFPTPT